MIAYGGVNWVGIVLAAIPPLWILSEPMDPKELYKKKENHRFSFFSVHKKLPSMELVIYNHIVDGKPRFATSIPSQREVWRDCIYESSKRVSAYWSKLVHKIGAID